MFSNYTKIGDKEGGIRYDIHANSYVVWIRENRIARDLTPAYGNGVDALNRLDDEMLKEGE